MIVCSFDRKGNSEELCNNPTSNQAHSQVLRIWVVNYIFMVEIFCFYYTFNKKYSWHNEIWGGSASAGSPWLRASFYYLSRLFYLFQQTMHQLKNATNALKEKFEPDPDMWAKETRIRWSRRLARPDARPRGFDAWSVALFACAAANFHETHNYRVFESWFKCNFFLSSCRFAILIYPYNRCYLGFM